MRIFLFFIIVLTLSVCSSAQKNASSFHYARLYGKVIDSLSDQPLEYATVAVYAYGSSKPLTGTITNSRGGFEIDSLIDGSYAIVVEFIGYRKRSLKISVGPASTSINLNSVELVNAFAPLNSVTVTAKTPLIENKVDKMVYNVEKDISSQGSVATDILKKIPQVSVDVDGNVELQGNANIRFLINGKPSTIFGSSPSDALQNIPASQIQSIEIITSPGAKYDAEGTAGIINIILKKSQVQGLNGNISLAGGSRLQNGSFNLNYRHNNLGLNAFFSGNAQINSTTIIHSDRLSNDTINKTTELLQNGNMNFTRSGIQTGIGLDWNLGSRDDLNGTLSYEQYLSHSRSSINQETIVDSLTNQISDLHNNRYSDNRYNSHSVDLNLNYRKTFKKENQELDVTYVASIGHNILYYLQSQNYLADGAAFSGSTSNNPGTDSESDFSIDYKHPVSKKFTLETGVKNMINKITSQASVLTLDPGSGKYVPDNTQSYVLHYRKNVFAYYLSGNFSLLNWIDILAGGRFEYTDTKADYSGIHSLSIPSYGVFVPSATVSHSFSDHENIKVSYTKRIERPEYFDLNPFLNFSDPHNISTGNPLLKPELGHKVELSYSKNYPKGANVNLVAFYQLNTQDIKSYITYYPSFQVGDSTYTDVAVSSRQNISSEQRIGLTLFGALPIGAKFNLRSNITVANRKIYNDLVNNTTNGFEYRFNLNASWQLSDNINFEAFGNFNSRVHNVQGLVPSFTYYNMALRRQLFHKNGSIALTTTNPFNKYVNQKAELSGPNFNLIYLRQIPFQSFGISFTYKFGKLDFKNTREDDLNSQVPPSENN